ncbi:hypothetical protein PHSC3_001133 [Chlamydiales bacterium STE3]|nr:hypothetical protein PHSC3_001133 [Chlamydiales bacterium STE3]
MSELTSTPYDWLRQIPKELKELDEIPLWGGAPPFSWEDFSKNLTAALKLRSCIVTPGEIGWREPSEIANKINEEPLALTFALNPLEGHSYLLLAHAEVEKLLKTLLHSDEEIPILEKDFVQGFYRFLGLEIADCFQKTGYEKAFLPQLLSQNEFPTEPCLCVDINIQIEEQELSGMLCISNPMRTAIKEYGLKKNAPPTKSLYNRLEITLQLVAGATTISQREWRASSPGDVIVLDTCTIEPGVDKGRVMLILNELPIFRGRIKDGNIKILEYPLFHEVQTNMSPNDFDDEDSDFDAEESDLDSDIDSDYDEESEEEESEFSDDDYSDEDYAEDEEDDEVEEDLSKQKDLKSTSPANTSKMSPQQTSKEPAQAAPSPASTKPVQLARAEEIPLTITVEVGRLQMTIQKLIELQPGNLLELDVHPENGVDLVVNGKCIGKGELLRIGDVLGVRILDKI